MLWESIKLFFILNTVFMVNYKICGKVKRCDRFIDSYRFGSKL